MLGIPTGEVDRLNVVGDALDGVRGDGQLGDALDGVRGDGQQRIARTGLEWICLLLAKNADYGSSVWKAPILCPGMEITSAILVRMSDKIERLRALLDREAEVKTESLEDTMRDLGSYCLLYLARPDKPVAAEAAGKER